MTRRGALAVGTLAAILAITASWWALALWPTGGAGPAWLERTRVACFGTFDTGLPNAGGWVLLIGEPIGMLGVLVTVWGEALREGVSGLWRSVTGRVAIGLTVAGVLAGIAAAGVRVREAVAEPPVLLGDGLPATRLDKPAPALELRNQQGEVVNLARFRGRPVVLTFGYGHCETVCPIVVEAATRAVSQTRDLSPALVVVTLDPWRDTPTRLGHLAEQWHLPAGAQLLGGEPAEVEAALDRWQVARSRDPDTGQITHGTPVFLIDRDGRIGFVASGRTEDLVTLLRLL